MIGPSLQKYLLKHQQAPYTESGAGHPKPLSKTMDSDESAPTMHEPEVQPPDPMHVQHANHMKEPVPPVKVAGKWSKYVAK